MAHVIAIVLIFIQFFSPQTSRAATHGSIACPHEGSGKLVVVIPLRDQVPDHQVMVVEYDAEDIPETLYLDSQLIGEINPGPSGYGNWTLHTERNIAVINEMLGGRLDEGSSYYSILDSILGEAPSDRSFVLAVLGKISIACRGAADLEKLREQINPSGG